MSRWGGREYFFLLSFFLLRFGMEEEHGGGREGEGGEMVMVVLGFGNRHEC